MNTRDIKDADIAEKIMREKEYFESCSAGKRKTMLECFQHYSSHTDTSPSPYLSNLFIPKTHEAVEMLAAYFAGSNQTVRARATEGAYMKQAKIGETLLQYQWRMKLRARAKIITWIKQCILFGNGIMKVGWDYDKDIPVLNVINLPDIYMDYYISDIQKSPVIHKIVKIKSELEKNKSYKADMVKLLVTGDEDDNKNTNTNFGQFDSSSTTASPSTNEKTTIYEYFSDDGEIITVGKTELGDKVIKRVDSDFKNESRESYKPFIKIICKNSPLSNRAYDIGAIESTINIQKAFNTAVNQFFDNVSLLNNKQWIKRRGANVSNLVRKPGAIITVDDINMDLKSEEVSDIKSSLIELIRFLDAEYQQSSMVVNLLKGVGGANFASEAMVGQQNVLNLFDNVNENIKDGMSELGQMLMLLNQQNLKDNVSLQILDTEEKAVFISASKDLIQGKYTMEVVADRKPSSTAAVRSKQLIDFAGIVSRDPNILAKYPSLPEKVYKKWLEENGIQDSDYYFEETNQIIPPQVPSPTETAPTAPKAKLLSPGSMEATGGSNIAAKINQIKL